MMINLTFIVICAYILHWSCTNEIKIEFAKDRDFKDVTIKSNPTKNCNDLPVDWERVQGRSGYIRTDTCAIVYQYYGCAHYESIKILPGQTVKYPWYSGSYHICNEDYGNMELNIEITKFIKFYPELIYLKSIPFFATFSSRQHIDPPETVAEYIDVCSCVNIPENVQKLEQWSINNHANELLAYFGSDCSKTKWQPMHIRAGFSTTSRQIYATRKTDQSKNITYKIQSLGPHYNSTYFRNSCRYTVITDLELFETNMSQEVSFLPDPQDELIPLSTQQTRQIKFLSGQNFQDTFLYEDISTECINFQNFANKSWIVDEIGSVKTNSCVILYSDHKCFGRSIKVFPPGSQNLTKNWEQTVTGSETLALLYSFIQSSKWTTKSFRFCNDEIGGNELNVDIIKYHPDILSLLEMEVYERLKNICVCKNIPIYIQELDRWSINNYGNSLMAYFEKDCLVANFSALWIPAGVSSFSIGLGVFTKTAKSHTRVHKIVSLGPDPNSAYFKANCAKIPSTVYMPTSTTFKPQIFNKEGEANALVYIGGLLGPIIALVAIALFVVTWKRTNDVRGKVLTREEIKAFVHGLLKNCHGGLDNITFEMQALRLPYNKSIEIHKSNFQIIWSSILGSGEFGVVYKAYMLTSHLKADLVALKTTKDNCSKTAVLSILSEIKILQYLGHHENIVSMKGAYTAEISTGVVYVAMELCELGSLKTFLQKPPKSNGVQEERSQQYQNTATPVLTVEFSDLVKWSYEIACGMEYLAEKNVIHADLATRNVLLTADKTAKITDFGLSRRLYEYTIYAKKQQQPLPWRWMAIEALKKLEFSIKSDVWSYGVTLWEIFSLGDVPYPGLSWTFDFVDGLETGLRMKCPRLGSPEIYSLMSTCWEQEPQNRPTFTQLKQSFARIIEINRSNLDVQNN